MAPSSRNPDKAGVWKNGVCYRWMSCGERRTRLISVSISNESTTTNSPEFVLVDPISLLPPFPPAVGSPAHGGIVDPLLVGAEVCFRLTFAPTAPHFPKATFTIKTDDCFEPVRKLTVASRLVMQ